MNINTITAVYFVDRRNRDECPDPLLPFKGKQVAGYDKTPSDLTAQLEP